MTAAEAPVRNIDWRRVATWCAALLALLAAGVAVRWGAFVAGGSDSHCYLAQARMWLDGSILRPLAPGFPVTWPEGTLSLAPTGFVPSQTVPGGIAPICPPGLALLMAGGERLATGGAFAVVPLANALLVWSAFVLARRLGGSAAGVMAAALTLTSPIVLFQAVQPMSDVPAAAGWLAALALAAHGTRARALGAGLATSVALLIRPNLAPLAAAAALAVAWASPRSGTPMRRVTGVVWYAAGTLPGVAAVAVLNQLLYGSPVASGYGDPGHLFAARHVLANVRTYPHWLVETETPWILAGLLAPLVLARRSTASAAGERGDGSRGLAVASLGFVCILLAVYLPYVPFDSWTYLRFLLPGVVVLIALSSAVSVRLLERAPRRVAAAVTTLLVVLIAGFGVWTARDRHAFDLRASEEHFRETGTWIGRELPPNAVVVTVWQSGSVRYYSHRPTVLWDALPPDQLERVLADLGAAGLHPYLLFEQWEVASFRERFAGHTPLTDLDWPPRAQLGRDIALYDPADRPRFLQGQPVRTERVWTAAELRALRRR